ncbi:mitochondrial inner membrane protease subunit 2 isoform X1 [Mirounga leonina]|uniref:mitochondrial inner membrane protease subunit 2 isoform X1 n=1 Tax=Mirounga leonina TaxID=9715 RepID=UPI00156C0C72|nr:mitochondrial inner membrane protease subunit 2 isoform X1 [Mirounga leonina]XP_034876827.1 mitochondrial inner membrane protease subunit 2 isoform X1 [Mirounga leonina]XP_034876828.1 mitochondrial inner membrane protease subunit 2 isoform X1 [Mirounga leonina]
MAQSQGWVRRYAKAFFKGFFVAVPVAVTFLDRVACVARVEGASMQPSLNPGGSQSSDVVLLNHWKMRNFEVQRGDIVSLVSPKNPEQKIIKRVIALEGDIVKTIGHKNRYVKVPRGHIWVEGDHHGHSFDSNSFGPVEEIGSGLSKCFTESFLRFGMCCGIRVNSSFSRTSTCPCYTHPVASRALAEIGICSSSRALACSERRGMMAWSSLSCWHWEAPTTHCRRGGEEESSEGQSLFQMK